MSATWKCATGFSFFLPVYFDIGVIFVTFATFVTSISEWRNDGHVLAHGNETVFPETFLVTIQQFFTLGF